MSDIGTLLEATKIISPLDPIPLSLLHEIIPNIFNIPKYSHSQISPFLSKLHWIHAIESSIKLYYS